MTQYPPPPGPTPEGKKWICCAYITKRGKRIYPKKGKAFCFWVDE